MDAVRWEGRADPGEPDTSGKRRDEEAETMGNQAVGTFEISGWEETPYDEREGVCLSRALVTKTFSGDVEGDSVAELLLAYGTEEGSAAYTGLERVVGRVHGRSGTFVLRHSATMERGEGEASVSVVPDSGTGELKGLRGEARISVEPGGGHSFTLDYDLDRSTSQRV
jgi:hypothetical protein